MFSPLAYLRTMRKPFESLDRHWERLKRMAQSHTHAPTKARAQVMLYESRTRNKRIDRFVTDFMHNAQQRSAERRAAELKHNCDPASIENFRRIQEGPAMNVDEAHRTFVVDRRRPAPAPVDPHRRFVSGHAPARAPRPQPAEEDSLLETVLAVEAAETVVETLLDDTPTFDSAPSIDTDAFSGGGGDFGGGGSDGEW